MFLPIFVVAVTANEQSKTDPPQEPTATDDKPTETHVPKPKPPQKKIPPICKYLEKNF